MNLKEIKRSQKKSPDELQEYLNFRRRGSIVPAKRGKELTVVSKNIKIGRDDNVTFLSQTARLERP